MNTILIITIFIMVSVSVYVYLFFVVQREFLPIKGIVCFVEKNILSRFADPDPGVSDRKNPDPVFFLMVGSGSGWTPIGSATPH